MRSGDAAAVRHRLFTAPLIKGDGETMEVLPMVLPLRTTVPPESAATGQRLSCIPGTWIPGRYRSWSGGWYVFPDSGRQETVFRESRAATNGLAPARGCAGFLTPRNHRRQGPLPRRHRGVFPRNPPPPVRAAPCGASCCPRCNDPALDRSPG